MIGKYCSKLIFVLLFLLVIGNNYSNCPCEEDRQNNTGTTICSPDGKYKVNIYPDKVALLKEVSTEKMIRRIRCNFIFQTIRFSPDSKYLATGSWGKFAKLWDIKQNICIRSFSKHDDWISTLNFSHNGKYLATGSQDFTAKLFDIQKQEELCSFIGHSSFITAVSFSPQDKYVITHAWDKTVKMWEIETCREIESFDAADSISFGYRDSYFIYRYSEMD